MDFRSMIGCAAVGLACGLAGSGNVARAAQLPYRSLILADGAAAYYELDDAAGSTTFADTKGGNAGTVHTGVTLGTVSGSALLNTAGQFDGSANAYLTVNNSVLSVGTGAFSAELWFKTTTSGRTDLLTYKTTGQTDFGIQSNTVGQGDETISYYHDGYLAKATGVTDNVFHQVVATRTAAGAVSLYIDGVFAASGTDTASTNQSSPLYLGSNHYDDLTPVLPVNGLLDEVSLYTTALTAQQVAAHYLAGTVPEPTSLGLFGASGLGLMARRRRHS